MKYTPAEENLKPQIGPIKKEEMLRVSALLKLAAAAQVACLYEQLRGENGEKPRGIHKIRHVLTEVGR